MDILSFDLWASEKNVEQFEFTLDELNEKELLRVREFSQLFTPLHGDKKIQFKQGAAIAYPECAEYHEMSIIRTAGFKFKNISIPEYQSIIRLVKDELGIVLTKRYG